MVQIVMASQRPVIIGRQFENTDTGVKERAGCPVCSHIIEFVSLPPFIPQPKKVSVGTVESLVSSDCKDHAALVSFIKRRISGNRLQNVELQLCRPIDVASGVYLMIATTSEYSEVVEHLHLKQQTSLSPQVGRALPLNVEWINVELLRQWKQTCIRHHGIKCETPYTVFDIPKVHPLWLVDTQKLCLVPGITANSFVTLSYVWGDSRHFTATKDNLEQLKKPGAFAIECFGKFVPKTIADSIALVPLLGERFLWVDALCILQDDNTTKIDELNKMAAIYASSVLTILAGDGSDCHHGLRGIRGVSNPRHVEQNIESFGPKHSLVGAIFNRAHEVLYLSAYRDRAWTFQESIFAKRRLIFQKGSVRWMCSESLWDEDLLFLDLDDSPKNRSFSILRQDGHFPSFSLLSVAINSFNRRKLMYPEDAVSAITGFLNILSQTFEGGFLFGMPEAFFDIALLWEPTPDMTRRKPKRAREELVPLLQVPTWSWAAWTGKSVARAWSYYETTDNSIHSCSLRRVIPTVQWFTMKSPSSKFRRHIEPRWFEYKSRAQELTKSLPSGWERRENAGEQSKCGSHTYHFTHTSTPGRRWKWPFPIPPHGKTPPIPEPTPYLFCRTSRAHLFTNSLGQDFLNIKCQGLTRSITDKEGNWVGVLFVQDRHSTDLTNQIPQKIELVAISRTICTEPDKEYVWERTYRKLPSDAPYEYYNVLWIGREMGVAYRKGLGRVPKEEWDRLREEKDIDLILG